MIFVNSRLGSTGGSRPDVALLGAVLTCALTTAGPLASADVPGNVRSTDSRIVELLNEGATRSETFRRLLSTIRASTDIVYVDFGYCAFGRVNGCLLPVLTSPRGDRYLRILIVRDKNRLSHDQLLALIGHELQHAVEVIDAVDVVDLKTMVAMYSRTGRPLTSGLFGFETSAARAAGAAVLSDLAAKDSRR
jgi:hypothetical protein